MVWSTGSGHTLTIDDEEVTVANATELINKIKQIAQNRNLKKFVVKVKPDDIEVNETEIRNNFRDYSEIEIVEYDEGN